MKIQDHLRVHDTARPSLLAPCDLQVIKAAGVTFVTSMLERVIKEQAFQHRYTRQSRKHQRPRAAVDLRRHSVDA